MKKKLLWVVGLIVSLSALGYVIDEVWYNGYALGFERGKLAAVRPETAS